MCALTELNIIVAPCAGRGSSRLRPGTTSLPGIHNWSPELCTTSNPVWPICRRHCINCGESVAVQVYGNFTREGAPCKSHCYRFFYINSEPPVWQPSWCSLMNTDTSVWYCLQTCAGQRISTKFCQKQDAYSTPSYVFGARSHGKPLFSSRESSRLLLSLHQTSGGVCLYSMAQALSSPT